MRIMHLLLLRSILPSVSMFCSEQMKSGAGGSSTQRDGVLAAVNLSQQKSSINSVSTRLHVVSFLIQRYDRDNEHTLSTEVRRPGVFLVVGRPPRLAALYL